MKKLIYILIIACILGKNDKIFAQFAYFLPNPANVEDSLTLYVDLTQDPLCAGLVNTQEQLYLWSWVPNDPLITNGTWGSSNEDLKMKNEGNNIWSFKMVPTQFYGVDAKVFYEKGIYFLAKKKNGGQGGDCSATGGEFKTSDISLSIPAPAGVVRKVLSYPDVVGKDTLYSRSDDVFTLIYNNFAEDKLSMQNIGNMAVYLRVVGTDNKQYIPISLAQLTNHPEITMTNKGGGVWHFSIIPDRFLKNYLPSGVKAQRLRIQLVTLPLCGGDCSVDGEFNFNFKCDN